MESLPVKPEIIRRHRTTSQSVIAARSVLTGLQTREEAVRTATERVRTKDGESLRVAIETAALLLPEALANATSTLKTALTERDEARRALLQHAPDHQSALDRARRKADRAREEWAATRQQTRHTAESLSRFKRILANSDERMTGAELVALRGDIEIAETALPRAEAAFQRATEARTAADEAVKHLEHQVNALVRTVLTVDDPEEAEAAALGARELTARAA